MGLARIPVGRLEKSSKADMLTRLSTRILICISRFLAVRNKQERKDNFESISKESFIVVRAKHQGELLSISSFFNLFMLSQGVWVPLFACY